MSTRRDDDAPARLAASGGAAGTSAELTYLEFYSGVGGWSYALEEACRRINGGGEASSSSGGGEDPGGRASKSAEADPPLTVRRLAAFDHSELCNEVLRHNFPDYCRVEGMDDDAGNDGGSGGGNGADGGDARDGGSKKRKRPRRNRSSSGGAAAPVSVEKLTPRRLSRLGRARIWAMSPPCQPFTRQHANQSEELDDPRNGSFLHLIELLRTMEGEALPEVVLMENVVGFEKSVSCRRWTAALSSRRYSIAHFHVTPTQVGLPNDRPRYYCVAVRKDGHGDGGGPIGTVVADLFREEGHNHAEEEERQSSPLRINTGAPVVGIAEEPPVGEGDRATATGGGGGAAAGAPLLPPVAAFLDADLCDGRGLPLPVPEDASSAAAAPPNAGARDGGPAAEEARDEKLRALRVPPKLLRSDASWCLDVVTPADRRSACFTSSYGRYARGTGSALFVGRDAGVAGEDSRGGDADSGGGGGAAVAAAAAERFKLVPPEQRRFDREWSDGLRLERNLRYFSGTEIARLMGFPVAAPAATAAAAMGGRRSEEPVGNGAPARTFSFPSSCTTKQQWRLLGNSLNVRVASRIAEIGLRSCGVCGGATKER